mgnify:FL=1
MEFFKWRNLKLFLITLVLSFIGVILFHVGGLPIPWLLGPIAAITVYRCFRSQPMYWPAPLRSSAFIIMGVMLGSSFSLEILKDLLIHLPAMLISNVLLIGISFLFAYFLYQQTDTDFQSSLLGSVPGGLSQVLIMSDELPNINYSIILLMQITRVLCVVFLVPFLAFSLSREKASEAVHGNAPEGVKSTAETEFSITLGDVLSGDVAAIGTLLAYIAAIAFFLWLARRIRLPSPYLIGPILGMIAMSVTGLPPIILPEAFYMYAQLVLGAYTGLQIQPQILPRLKKLGIYIILYNIVLIGFGMLLSLGLAWIYDISFHTAFLGTAPGGIAEMGVTATAVHADLAVVTGYQIFRLFFILFLFTAIVKWWQRRIALEQN